MITAFPLTGFRRFILSIFHENLWQAWLILACIIITVELILLNSYYLIAMAIAASLAGLAAWFGASINMQWLAFIFGSIAGLTGMHLLRPSAVKQDKDDISHMEGKIVTIIEDVSPRGRASYKSVGWAAESDDVLHIGESARIVRVHGSTLYLEAMKER